jgi:DNA polymerase sigma
MFGSLATGLALDTSDMDLAIKGLNLFEKSNTVESLLKLSKHLKEFPFVSSLNPIETASVPVIKLVLAIL